MSYEIAYRLPGSGWRRLTCRTEKAFWAKLEKLADQGAETRTRTPNDEERV